MATPKDQVSASINQARTELERALVDLEKMPAFDSGAVSFAAHAINNFLTVTGGATDLLIRELKDYPNPQIHTWLDGIQQATEMMAHIATDLINNASIASEPKLRFDTVNVAMLVQRACEYYQKQARPKNIEVVWQCSEVQLEAWTDRVALAAVLDNLLSNAVKYSPPGTTIHVEAEAVNAHVVCRVQDEGPGLSTEELKQLFQKGVRLSAQPTGGEPSTGYGLAVAKELTTLLNGEIWCESEVGKGARFSVRIPKRPAE